MKKPTLLHALLLWEDIPRRDQLATILRMHQYAISLTGDALQGLSMLEKEDADPFSLVIIGDHVKSLNAWELIPIIRSTNSKECLPILFIHPGAQDDEVVELMAMGVSEVLSKAYSQEVYKYISARRPKN